MATPVEFPTPVQTTMHFYSWVLHVKPELQEQVVKEADNFGEFEMVEQSRQH